MSIQGWPTGLWFGLGVLGFGAMVLAEKSQATPSPQTPSSRDASSQTDATDIPSPALSASREKLWSKVWEPKTATLLIKKQRFRSGICAHVCREVQRDIRRQHFLLRNMASLLCDPKEWRRCRGRGLGRQKGQCSVPAKKQQWSACFRTERRLDVITERLVESRKQGLREKCRWMLTIPARFQRIHFAPHPKLSDVEKVR